MNDRQDISRSTIVFMLLCLGGVAIYVFWGIVPLFHTSSRLDAEAQEVRVAIERQKVYHQLYSELQTRVRRRSLLKIGQSTALPREQIDKLFTSAERLAREHSVKLIAASPDLKTLAPENGSVAAEIVIEGDLPAFKGFLQALLNLPFLNRVETLVIEQGEGGKRCQLKVWLQLVKGEGV